METLEYKGNFPAQGNPEIHVWSHKDGHVASGCSGYDDYFMWHNKNLYTIDDLKSK